MNHSFSDVEEMQSACDHLMRLENVILGELGKEKCSMCLLSLNLFCQSEVLLESKSEFDVLGNTLLYFQEGCDMSRLKQW